MNLNRFRESWFTSFVLVMWLISTIFMIALLNQLDRIVHNDLYNFGLQFSYDWAIPYWTSFRLIYVCLIFPSALSIFVLVLNSLKLLKNKEKVSVPKVKVSTAKPIKPKKEESFMLIACNSCGKTFSKPLCILDFSSGKAKLLNVCPYCGAKLGENSNAKNKDFDVRIPNGRKTVHSSE